MKNDKPHVTIEAQSRRMMIPEATRCIGVAGDNRAERVDIDFPRWYDGIDLGGKHIYILVHSEAGESDTVEPEVTADAELLHAVWTVSAQHAARAGRVYARIRVTDTDGFVWQSLDGEFSVESVRSGAGTLSPGQTTAVNQALLQMAAAKEQVQSALERLSPPVIPELTGLAIAASDSANRPLQGLTVYGKTTQDGTPGEDAPVEMHSVGDAGEVTVSVLAGLPEGGTDRIAIIRQPRDMTAAVDSAATFRVFAIGRGLTYQWEYMISGSTIWKNNSMPGNNTDTLTFSAKAYHDGYKYRCLIMDASGNAVRTDEVTLTIGEASGSSDDAADTQTAAISIADGLRGVPDAAGKSTYTDTEGQGWIADTIEYDAQTGTAQFVRRVGRVTLDGDAGEEWTLDTQNNPYLAIAVQGKATGGGLCTHYSRAEIEPGTGQTGFSADASGDKIVFRPADFATITVDAWRARLNASPVTVLYALAVPVVTELSEDALTAMSALRSRYPEMTIYNDAEAQMEVRYVADTKNYVDRRIEQLTDALVSTGANI